LPETLVTGSIGAAVEDQEIGFVGAAFIGALGGLL
jgi:hypothetical protein